MKKLLVLLGILAAFSFVACNKEADPVNPPASDPIENEDTGDDSNDSVRKWESAIGTDGAQIKDNGDGTFTATFVSQYSGTGFVVYLNEDKSKIDAGKEVTIKFDYETVSWSDDTLFPKFKFNLATDAENFYTYTACTKDIQYGGVYRDADSSKGELEVTLVAEQPAEALAMQFNAYEWSGNTETDSIKITLKSLEIK